MRWGVFWYIAPGIISIVSYIISNKLDKISKKLEIINPHKSAVAKTASMIVALAGGIAWELAARYDLYERFKWGEIHDKHRNRAMKWQKKILDEVIAGVLSDFSFS